ncbi:MAG: protein kinase [Deltaproteobacteria bacterium]|nr:protein kinase [Deltaproteobacteria bacterium]
MLGATIGGKFVLREVIGSGGMGRVYRADQLGVGRSVAVKIMHRHLLGDETALARFTNEARAASQLNHPHSIAVLDFGQNEAGILYIVMEYLRGRSLDRVLRQDYPLPLGRVAHTLCQAMEAVDAAHHLNIIHRDLKPENVVLLEQSGFDFVKVLDFGIAKMLDLEDRSVTTPGLVPGTPEYMSPEQARGEKLDPRSDVYALGVILYELLTGTVPFKGKSAVATMMAHVQTPPEPPSRRRPERRIPPALDAIVLWALAKDPADRIASAAQFRDVLSAWAQMTGVWPEGDPRASSPDVLLEFFSEEQIDQLKGELGPRSEGATSEAAPRVATNPHATPGAIRRPAPLLGRTETLRTLDEFLGGSGPRALRLQAEAGLGKSRVLDEVIRRAERRGMSVVRCRPDPGWTPRPLRPAQETIAACLDLPPEQSVDPELLRKATEAAEVDRTELPGLHDIFGLPSPLSELDADTRRRERSAAFRETIRRRASRRPLLLVYDDLQRFDEPSRELVASLAASPRGDVALLISHTPDAMQLWPQEVRLLELPPLDIPTSADLLHALLGAEAPTDGLEALCAIAAGQPLFLEQLAFARARDSLADPPEKVADLVAVRLQRVEQRDRRVLQNMAVLAEPADAERLTRLMSEDVGAGLLDRLVDLGFLTRNRRQHYTFVHPLVGMVVYSSIPAEVRREIHGRAARLLREEGRPDVAVATHAYESDDSPVAIRELERVGLLSARWLDHPGAIRQYSRAVELIRREWGRGRMSPTDLDHLAVQLAQRLSTALRANGDLVAAEGVLEEILSVAAGHEKARASLRLELGRIDLERGNVKRAGRRLELALVDARAAGDEGLMGEVTRELARAVGLGGDRERAGRMLLQALELTGRIAHPREPAWSTLLSVAVVCSQVGFAGRALGYLLDALQLAERDRSASAKLRIVVQMAEVHLSCGEWTEAQMRATQAIELAKQVGDRARHAALLLHLGRIHRIGGDVEEARRKLDEAVEVARSIDWWEGIRRVEQETEMLRYALPQVL